MLIDEALPDVAIVHRRVRVQGDAEQRRARGQPLENIHVVGDAGPGPIPVAQAIVPAGPGALALRQPARIAVQHHLVALPADIPEDFAFGIGGRRQHRQGLRGVAGEDHLVKMRLPGRQPQGDPRRVTVHLLYRRVEPQIQTIAEPGEQGANVLPGTAGHHVPLRAIANIQQAVVFKEA